MPEFALVQMYLGHVPRNSANSHEIKKGDSNSGFASFNSLLTLTLQTCRRNPFSKLFLGHKIHQHHREKRDKRPCHQ